MSVFLKIRQYYQRREILRSTSVSFKTRKYYPIRGIIRRTSASYRSRTDAATAKLAARCGHNGRINKTPLEAGRIAPTAHQWPYAVCQHPSGSNRQHILGLRPSSIVTSATIANSSSASLQYCRIVPTQRTRDTIPYLGQGDLLHDTKYDHLEKSSSIVELDVF